MMEIIFFTCCDRAIIDVRTNNLSVINFIEIINSPVFPLALPPISIVAWAKKSPKEADTKTVKTVWQLDGRTIGELPLDLKFQGKPGTRSISEINGLVIESPGILDIQLRDKAKILARWKIIINNIGTPRSTDQVTRSAKTPTKKTRRKTRGKRAPAK